MNGVSSIETSNFYIPASLILVPGSFRNLMLKLAIFSKVVFVAEILKVKAYFIWACIHWGPWRIGFEAPGINMCGYITCTANQCCEDQKQKFVKSSLTVVCLPWIVVLVPCAWDSIVFLVQDEFELFEGALQFIREEQSRCPGSDANDFERPFLMQWPSQSRMIVSWWRWVYVAVRHSGGYEWSQDIKREVFRYM